MRTSVVIGNWKMNGDRVANIKLLDRLEKELSVQNNCAVVVCPPFPFLSQVAGWLLSQKINIGAQNVSAHNYGAHTGEVCGQMLTELGCSYVLLGHSERRADNYESDTEIAAKFAAAIETGLTPVLCVGETLDQKNAGLTQSVVTGQITSVIEQLGISVFNKAIIAYEPVWAIGTGETATPEQAQAVHLAIRTLIRSYDNILADKIAILYGGSVKASNAKALFSQIDIDGALVGGAALDADQFISICNAAA
ncbi:triose-phosphate isomerase [Amphritea balenae]|uniref:Triosephosphate isomerase n=1 Tax=Amphritea balenae TaxID=452629 RepID=A0A3P1SWP3_9GAMM|nr:triose-phosphate isomerase [Amphritea balenae]RRD01652.1 triose-phosphate isomerase [Amphritea balenae]GGK55285.1 triosephosphate isomerase [Amphritea balenae]